MESRGTLNGTVRMALAIDAHSGCVAFPGVLPTPHTHQEGVGDGGGGVCVALGPEAGPKYDSSLLLFGTPGSPGIRLVTDFWIYYDKVPPLPPGGP